MFISKAEKNAINARLESLEIKLNFLTLNKASNKPPMAGKKRGYKWSDEERMAASERMKKSWADRKANKGAA
jgi:hypothetical protein